MSKLSFVILALSEVVFLGIATVHAQPVLYVNAAATGADNGTSWEDAFVDLQDALTAAAQSGGAVSEVWAAAGTYRPADDGDRSATFQLLDELAIYGGFAGGETSLDERDPAANVTILSGDLNGDDDSGGAGGSDCCVDNGTPGCEDPACETAVCAIDPFCCEDRWDGTCAETTICVCGSLCSDQCDNSFHVVTSSGVGETAILDGFTIMAGFASGDALPDASGAGVLNEGGSPTLRNCVLTGNRADEAGGGLYNVGGSPMLMNCTLEGNTAGSSGGGADSAGGAPILVGCLFVDNIAFAGAGLSEHGGDAKLINCTFRGNTAELGGGIDSDGGSPLLFDCLLNGNSASINGGAVRCINSSAATITNCTFSWNYGATGGGVHATGSSPVITGCILWGNSADSGVDEPAQIHSAGSTPIVNYCTIQGLTGGLGGTGNIGEDPLFVDPDGQDDETGTADDDFQLLAASPAIDAADNLAVPSDSIDLDDDGDTAEPIPLDLNGDPRFIDGALAPDSGQGSPPIVDMGAFEQNDCNDNGVPDPQDIAEETSPDCNENGVPDECDLLGGLSADCQPNGIPDECDIADGTSFDLNQDGIPDECQDCQPNGLPDFIDIAYGVSEDCNENEVPDECDTRDGTSEDCQEDEIPDECQLEDNDCNSNDVPDECDITQGISEDCDGDNVPDECEDDFDGDGIIDDCDGDIDGDGVPNEEDVCDYTPPGQQVNSRGGPLGDANDDCDVDLNDFFFFEICLSISGPDSPPLFQDCLQLFDLDEDDDVDVEDFGQFQRSFTGEQP